MKMKNKTVLKKFLLTILLALTIGLFYSNYLTKKNEKERSVIEYNNSHHQFWTEDTMSFEIKKGSNLLVSFKLEEKPLDKH